MKKYYLFLLLAAFILAIACGGGGGSNTVTPPPQGLTKAEAVLAGTPSQIVDAKNIQVGETIQFEVVNYSAANVRTVIPTSNWTTTDNGSSVGTLSSSGVLSASASANSIFTASTTVNGTTYSIAYEVKPVEAIITGTVIDSNGKPAPNVVVDFYNSLGSIDATSTTAQNGSLWASVPLNTTRFNLAVSSMPISTYFRSFVFGTKRYTALVTTCTAPLPALASGVATHISPITIDAAITLGQHNAPPPPPTGCS